MTTDLQIWYARRRAFVAIVNSTEVLLAFHAFTWGIILMTGIARDAYGTITLSLTQLAKEIPVYMHGVGLVVLCVLHCLAISVHEPRARKWCVFGQMLFFTYAWCALVVARQWAFLTFVLPVYVALCMANFGMLSREAAAKVIVKTEE